MAKKSEKAAVATEVAKGAKNEENAIDESKALSLKGLTKSSVWDLQESDVLRMLDSAVKDAEIKENMRHYFDIIRSAFMLEELKDDSPILHDKYTKQGYQVCSVAIGESAKQTVAIKKRPIMRVTDLTYENIRHISAAKLMEVIDRNFGGGWESLSQSIQDIIESGFDISTTTLPKDRLHKKGGMYEKKVADGYEVLEIEKGTWVEAIFAKLKPETFKPRMKFDSNSKGDGDDEDDEDIDLPEDDYNRPDEDDIELEEPNDEDITEDNYSSSFVIDTDDDDDAENMSDYIADE